MWSNSRWLHMWTCFPSRVCSTSLHGWDSQRKHQIGCIEKILNVGICVLRGSQKRSGKELLHRIEQSRQSLKKESAFKMHSKRKAVWIALTTADIQCLKLVKTLDDV